MLVFTLRGLWGLVGRWCWAWFSLGLLLLRLRLPSLPSHGLWVLLLGPLPLPCPPPYLLTVGPWLTMGVRVGVRFEAGAVA